MLLTIFNLPSKTRYSDIKLLIHSKCGFKDVILDNLTNDGNNTKKVTVGLAEEEDAAILVRKINGLYIDGQQLYVEAIKNKQTSAPTMIGQPQPTLQQPFYQQNYQPYQMGYSDMQQTSQPLAFGLMYGGEQNAFANYGYPQQMQYQSTQMVPQSLSKFNQGAPLGFSNQGSNPSVWSDTNDWNSAGKGPGVNQVFQQGKSSSRWEHPGDNSSSRRNGSNRENDRDRSSRGFGRDPPARDSGRNERNFGRNEMFRDSGRGGGPRDFGRSASSRDFAQNDAPRGYGRDDSSRDRGRDSVREHGRDASARDRRKDAPARDRGRDPDYRPASARVSSPYRRNEPKHIPMKRQFSPSRDKPQPKPLKTQSNNGPASKRPRNVGGFDGQKGGPLHHQNPKPLTRKEQKLLPERLALRADTWRHQIASATAKEMLKNPDYKNDIDPDTFLQDLKRAIRFRLEKLFGDDYMISVEDMTKIYRQIYTAETDAALFEEVTLAVKEHGAYHPDEKEKVAPKTAIKVEQKKPSAMMPPPAAPAPLTDTKNIPSYPKGDKTLNKIQKKTSQQIFQNEDSLLCQLKPNMLKALNEEIEEMSTMIVEDLNEDLEPELSDFHERHTTTVVNDYKKMLKVNVAKRILNVGPIMLRIFNTPKMISRGRLASVLAEYGVNSLRKAEKKKPPIYYGTCETYEVHDKLCSMEPLVVDGSKVTIKPFQLTGKDKTKERPRTIGNSNSIIAERTIAELEELDDEIDEEQLQVDADYDNEEHGKESIKKEKETQEQETDATETVENIDIKPETQENNTEQKTDKKNVKTEENSNQQDNITIENNDIDIQNDFTADVDIDKSKTTDNSFKIDAEAEHNESKDLSEFNSEELEDFRRQNIIDEIDIDNVNDDDWEDW